jgi:hypothetical protein
MLETSEKKVMDNLTGMRTTNGEASAKVITDLDLEKNISVQC